MLRRFMSIGILAAFLLGWPSLSADAASSPTSSSCLLESKKSPIIVLSIDGAAIRGIAQFELLLGIEEKVNETLAKAAQAGAKGKTFSYARESITDIVDFFAGTSAGSINVGGMLIPVDDALANTSGYPTKPKFTLAQLKSKLPETLKAAFSSSLFRQVRIVGGLFGSKFTAGPFEELLQGLTGPTRLSDLVKPALITSYDLQEREIMNFSTRDACALNPGEDVIRFQPQSDNHFFRKDKNVFLWQAIRASSAAPTFYKPLGIEIGGKQRTLIDAGLFIMSPTLLAWVEAQKIYPGRPIIIISISSGDFRETRKIKTKGSTAGSIPEILIPTIESAFEGQQALTDSIMKDLPGIQYFRLSFDVKNKGFDDTSDKNIKMLEEAAQVTIASDEFKKAVQAISKARLERREKQDLKPYICPAKERWRENQKSLIPSRRVDIKAGVTDEKITEKINKAYESQKAPKLVPETMKAQMQALKALCQTLLNQNKKGTSPWKSNRCDTALRQK